MKLLFSMLGTLALVSAYSSSFAADFRAENAESLQKAIAKAQAGDNIILENGTYTDLEIVFSGEGTKDEPITLKAETNGKVFIEGESNLRLGGSYLNVEGLHFRNGYSADGPVVSFRIDSQRAAFHSKFTNSVIEEFTHKDREVKDTWVEFWGQHNELSNNYIAGKSNFGPTVMVQLKGNQHVNNHHQIINNHFGPRPRKGGPHGETMQIGDSSTSMTPSYTNVEGNLFDRCNGEVEIISSKSNFNQFKNNVFYKSEGSLVLRHGNYATIDGNVFIGGDSEFYGGIRVINTGHWITNNYFYKLSGEKFRAPIAVMNGIPKSPLNRYNQVTDVVLAYNSFVETPTPWYFSVGTNIDQSDVLPKSEIRSARPTRTIFANNLIYNSDKAEYPIYSYDKVDGVEFKNNISNHANKSEVQDRGVAKKRIEMTNIADYLMVPTSNHSDTYHGFDFDKISTDLFGNSRADSNSVGAVVSPVGQDVTLIDKSLYGTSWFNPEPEQAQAKTIPVTNSEDLVVSIQSANAGDIIELSAGTYKLTEAVDVTKALTLRSANSDNRATINVTAEGTAFTLHPSSHLHIDGVQLLGNQKQNAFTTLKKHMSKAYDLTISNSDVSNFANVLDVSRGSFADDILVTDSSFTNNQNGFLLNKETRNKGNYNVEFLTITGSTFDSIAQSVLDFHRGGYDESTIGGNLVFENNTVTNSGKMQQESMLIKNRGIVNVSLANNTFKDNPVKVIAVLWGEKGQKPENNEIKNSGEIKVVQNLKLELMY
ncbi:DUF4957 domain-containing protein [Gilvimarinus agarilyticus]|uniref:chondroitinase-B domain-containing protein n=1 Tax=Gilvimarinus sp. 2_MG-2023 TaxID=3062666 RepID=UPI001C08B895|nr:chondroitinase-B domain-containing protein [Gilvimarinus sp. 2_MG-2023]MBU2887110.1 DUF4957 domain-containing protein [Gilvimarinus agarilyticus]MDO6571769.1 chondroitinase-B domain-containing protein [Gilvimarinus sp. 2_MG-2023]